MLHGFLQARLWQDRNTETTRGTKKYTKGTKSLYSLWPLLYPVVNFVVKCIYFYVMKILVTGANGFLGYYLIKNLLSKHYVVIATGIGPCRLPFTNTNFTYTEMDFTDPFRVHDVFEQYKPTIVVHAGAMTKPDDCENDQWKAYVTNVEATLTLLMNAEEQKAHFIFISTDFVFSGNDEGFYKEDDAHAPVNFYGKTKSEAEEGVREYQGLWSIVRTVLVYGNPATGKGNLLTVVKDHLSNGKMYSVFNDQVRTPTYVEDLAEGIAAIIEGKHPGIFHLSGEDVLTPYDMAMQTAAYLHLDTSLLKEVTAAELVQVAKRPAKTGLNIEKAKRILNYKPRSFAEGLKKTFE
jgi:dTDP-4-dehydrorhamnose reductase